MKKNLIVILTLMLALSSVLAGCKASIPPAATPTAPAASATPVQTPAPTTPAPEPTDTATGLSGGTKDILAALFKKAALDFDTFDETVTAENCQSYLGLTPEQLAEYAEEASASPAAMNVSAHLMALVKCKDAAAAAEVKKLVAEGFDAGRWVCVFPDQAFVVDAGAYVLLVATYDEIAAPVQDAFLEMAGADAGEVDTFFNFES